ADYLVRKGLPFRKAHAVVGQCVAYAIKENKFLLDMTLDEYKTFSELFEPDLMQALDPEHCVNARVSYGGPSYVENDKQLEKGEAILKAQEDKLKTLQKKI
ncbi:MAG TPA: argininosuccinate lyase, partial [Acidaminococcaceae bacterium]|nr:argininosuccinate lyase [Acidaminococcaceae bacterium]